MKKGVRITCTIAASIVALLLLIAFTVSPIAEFYIEKNSEKLIGRKIAMNDLSINLFSGKVVIDGLTVNEHESNDTFLSLNRFETRINLLPLLWKSIDVKRLYFDGLYVQILQNGQTFNFSDFIGGEENPETTEPEEKPDEAGSPWEIRIRDIRIGDSRLFYEDQAIHSAFNIDDLSLNIPEVYFSGQSTDIGLHLNFKQGGTLNTQLQYDIETGTYRIRLALDDLAIAPTLPYWQQALNISKVEGVLGIHTDIQGDIDHLMDFTISGNVSLAKFNMEQNGASVLSLDSIYTAIDSIQLQQGFAINEIYIKGLSTGYDVYNDRTSNLDYLFIAGNDSIVEANEPVEEPDSTTAAMPRIRIEKLRIADTRIRYTDATMYKPFDYTVSDIEVTADRFDSDSINSLQLKATLQEKGNARINWRGRIDSLSDLSLLLTLDNVQLTDFTPFCGQMFGYPIHSGILSFSSRNDIRNNQLTGTNKLDILRCELGSKESNVDAEMNLPLKMGLYLLKDKNDHIKIDLPIKGDISSPQFSYKKIILNTLTNILVKVTTAPIRILADAMGLNGMDLQNIVFDPATVHFTTEQYEKLENLSKIVQSNPGIRLKITQRTNYAQAQPALAERNLQHAYYVQQNPDKATSQLEILDMDAIAGIDLKSADVAAFADRLLNEKGLSADGSITDKATALFNDRIDSQINRISSRRERLVREHLTQNLHVADSLLQIITLPIDSMKIEKGNSRFAIDIELTEETK